MKSKNLFPLIIYFKKYLIILFVVLLLEIIASFFLIISITPLAEFVLDDNLKKPSYITEIFLIILKYFNIEASFFSFSFIFILGNFSKAIIETFTRYICLKIKYVLFENLSEENLKLIFESNWKFFGNADHGKLMNSFQKELDNISSTISHMAQQLAYLFQLAVYFIIPFWINFELTLIALLSALIFMTPFLFLHKYSLNLGKKNTSTANIMIGKLYELFQTIRLTISHNKQNKTIENYLDRVKSHSKAAVKSQLFISGVSLLFQPFTILAAITAVGVSGNVNNNLPETAAVLWSLMRAMPILSKLLQSNLNITNLLPSLAQMNDLTSVAKINKAKIGRMKIDKINETLTLKDVSFNYSKRKFGVKNININITHKNITALVGPSGSGKSTIIDLILGLQIPDKGKILLGNTPFKDINLNSFREEIGYVPQDPQLFDMTLRENLVWFKNKISHGQIVDASKKANAYGFINKLPKKFDTVAGNQGNRFSGGQRQRLAIARALLHKPSLLIFDEATSALDKHSDAYIKKTLQELKGTTTIFIVSHKLETLKHSDYIYVINNGQIAESGDYISLTKNKEGLFSKMINKH